MHENKVVLLTGASSEMGVYIVAHLLERSCVVYGQVHNNAGTLTALAAHKNLHLITADLRDKQAAETLVRHVVQKAGRLDALINLIGPYDEIALDALSPEHWRSQIHLNLDLVFFMTHFAKQPLMATKGHIINFAFAGAELIKARPVSTAYCIAKTGVVILTKSLAHTLGAHGIRVNIVSPGLMRTPDASAARLELINAIPMSREGQPEELATTLSWLLFDSPAYINGANIAVSGAWEFV